MNRTFHRIASTAVHCAMATLLTLGAVSATAKDLVKIAFIGPLTGGVSSTGLGGRNSAQLAVDQHNADPSKKYRFELVKLDDECKPAVGVQVVTRAATDRKIIGAVGHYCSAVAIVTVDTFHRFGLPLVIWGAVLPEITYGNDYKEIHRVNGTMINEGNLAAEYVHKAGFKRVAMIYDTTDYGKGQSVHFAEALKQYPDITVTGSYGVDVTQQDFSAELTAAQRGKPDVIWFGGLTPQGVAIKAQLQRIGIATPFIGVSGILNEGFVAGLGAAVAEGVVSFHNGAPIEKYAKGTDFLAAYKAAGFKEEPDAYGPFAYSAANLLMDVIERVGPDRAKVREELNATRDYESLVGPISFDDHRQNITSAHQYVVQDGKWVYWADSRYAKEEK
ncbi:branched-chain amino acid ABC transporter substrate-binding protein [Thauera sp. SDU_THAU2]|uniref:branched-chain amino acid ABC transporter substrate-binding protein n=1 Tax=Thauera sp. SDU_THAU2 TaxID=3136633 RepID=UPI00311F689F